MATKCLRLIARQSSCVVVVCVPSILINWRYSQVLSSLSPTQENVGIERDFVIRVERREKQGSRAAPQLTVHVGISLLEYIIH
jgi:hypothetical protein